jgi:dipeptidyl aminopeptidase/acylaminoacyl peptidase
VVQAFKLLENWPGVDPRRIGIIAFSAGVTLACSGAADPRMRDRVAFVAVLGGYFDVTSLLRTVGQRTQSVDGHVQPWQPIPTPLHALASTVSSGSDVLTPTENRLLQKAFPEDNVGPPLTRREQAELAPGVAAFYHLLEGDEPGEVEHNINALPPEIKALLVQLSPMAVIGQIHAPIHLLHDRDDPSIPFSQGLEFAAALARMHHSYDFAGYSIFSHVEVKSGLSLGEWVSDGSKLFQALNSILLVGS